MATAASDLIAGLARTTDQVTTAEELRTLLIADRPLRIKYGVDCTAPFLHIGHAVNLWMMRRLQDAGHRVIFLLGDVTTAVGDPTGRDQTRPALSTEQINANAVWSRKAASASMDACSSTLMPASPSPTGRCSRWANGTGSGCSPPGPSGAGELRPPGGHQGLDTACFA